MSEFLCYRLVWLFKSHHTLVWQCEVPSVWFFRIVNLCVYTLSFFDPTGFDSIIAPALKLPSLVRCFTCIRQSYAIGVNHRKVLSILVLQFIVKRPLILILALLFLKSLFQALLNFSLFFWCIDESEILQSSYDVFILLGYSCVWSATILALLALLTLDGSSKDIAPIVNATFDWRTSVTEEIYNTWTTFALFKEIVIERLLCDRLRLQGRFVVLTVSSLSR